MSELRLSQLPRCFEGLIPCALATSTKSGVPNVTYLSQLLYVDETHVGLSRQFFNKTRKNLEENPYACLQVHDALTYEVYQFHVRFERSEDAGPLFDEQVARLDAIASHTGMSGVFKLQAIDICEVLRIEKVEGFMAPAEPGSAQLSPDFERGPLTELRALQLVSDRMNRARELDELLTSALDSFATWLDLQHSMVLLSDEAERRLTAIASHGYGESGVGAEVAWGDGLLGMAALNRRLIRVSGLRSELRYSLAARERLRETGSNLAKAEVALPGLPKPESQLALPMLVGGELVGVLWFESATGVAFRTWHEAFLQLLANQLAIAIARLREESAEAEAADEPAPPSVPAPSKAGARRRTFTLFKNDACIYVDGEYLVRNVPARILWKLLSQHAMQGRSDFNNRELRLDPNLGLPPVRDNLESRLVLLRKRLAEKCPDLQLVPNERGRFRLEVGCEVSLVEREHA